MKTSWSSIAREQADKSHKTEVDALKAKLAQYAASVESLEKQLGIALSLGKTRIRPQPLSVNMNDKAEAVAIAMASDWHVEETVEAASVNGLNEYRLPIAKTRIEKFFSTICRLTEIERQQFPVWDARLGRKNLVWGYRQRQAKSETPDPKPTQKPTKTSVKTPAAVEGIPPHLLERVTQTCQRYAGHSAAHIADRCRWANEARIHAPAIRALLDKLSL